MSTRVSNTIACCIAALACAATARAQQSPLLPVSHPVTAGSEGERYLRVLQLLGKAELQPWSVRAFGRRQLELLQPNDSIHPWNARGYGTVERRARLSAIAPEARLAFNSAYPFGYNDGAVWAGRGATLAVSGGVAASYGPLDVALAPIVFTTQNREFLLLPNGQTGAMAFADGRLASYIDRPQRFGDGTYARLDPGQSGVRVEGWGLAAGFSTANQFWGPAVEHPVLMGNNAAGFAHVFLGTSRPIDVFVGRVHGRVVWGRLEQSDYSAMSGDLASRLGTGLVGTFTPRGLSGLELGVARFFHVPWPSGGLTGDHLLKPFEGILKQTLATPDNPSGNERLDNQLASFFARWVFPRGGVEVYAEYGREDHSWDARDFWLEPDHVSAYTLGLQKAWQRGNDVLVGRAEVLNTRISHLVQGRGQSPLYVHSGMRQGHTNRGQVLGSVGGPGGGAAVLAADYYTPDGRLTLSWSRIMRSEARSSGGIPVAADADVMHAAGADVLLFRRHADVLAGLTAVQDFNRDGRGDRFNLNLSLGARARW